MQSVVNREYSVQLSVIVCTYNRSSLLKDCLDTLVEQNADSLLYEVVIVDNNSTDNTVEVAGHFIKSYSNIRLVLEKKQGLGHARNRGWHEAKGKYVAYIDDDARARNDWIHEMHQFTMRHPEIQAFGGPYFPFSFVEIPDWMPDGFGKNFLGEIERPIQEDREWISGSNMVFSRKLLEKMCGFRTDIGMSGARISYGEETFLFRKIVETDEKIFYVPKMKVDHLVAEYKMRVWWLLKSSYSMGRCNSRKFITRRPVRGHIRDFKRSFVEAIQYMLRGLGSGVKATFLTAFRPVFFQAGALAESIMIALGKEDIDL
ncbi:Glycosyltransferase, GT2 family [Candidatus Electrothrix aarhusensis]|uniref:Glycosyltransferase, GT2 family n=1 Tax=Candidatus Electrothrix aarhusensis TaxID=1859131 RepID=A0A3S3RSC8_9BACT|nr:Glycosyltransferase, GT2 family [Candidatus Electrothrix aarhusensis]